MMIRGGTVVAAMLMLFLSDLEASLGTHVPLVADLPLLPSVGSPGGFAPNQVLVGRCMKAACEADEEGEAPASVRRAVAMTRRLNDSTIVSARLNAMLNRSGAGGSGMFCDAGLPGVRPRESCVCKVDTPRLALELESSQ